MSALFLDYDREALDREYFIRGRLPAWDDWIKRLQGWSQDERSKGACELNVSYGSRARQFLDLFPHAEKDAPLLVFVHGGYWRMLDKGDFSFLRRGLAARGFAVACVNYRLLPDATMGEMIDDVQLAVDTALSTVSNRIYLCGHSAGAQLAAHALVRGRSKIAGFIGLSGVYDLRPVAACFLNDCGFLGAAEIEQFAAKAAVPGTACPGLFAYGLDEGAEFQRQSAEQADHWSNAGSRPQLLPIEGLNHASIVAELYDPDSKLCQAIAEFVGTSKE